jgi:hypothetical protein
MWIFLLVGLAIGGVLSVIFGVYSKAGSSSYSRTIFGMQSTQLITDAVLLLVGASVVFLAVVSALVKDLAYPTKKPLSFAMETLAMATFSSMTIFLMTYLRGIRFSKTTVEEFFILFAKFGVLHILLQFSGFYSYIFS